MGLSIRVLLTLVPSGVEVAESDKHVELSWRGAVNAREREREAGDRVTGDFGFLAKWRGLEGDFSAGGKILSMRLGSKTFYRGCFTCEPHNGECQ